MAQQTVDPRVIVEEAVAGVTMARKCLVNTREMLAASLEVQADKLSKLACSELQPDPNAIAFHSNCARQIAETLERVLGMLKATAP